MIDRYIYIYDLYIYIFIYVDLSIFFKDNPPQISPRSPTRALSTDLDTLLAAGMMQRLQHLGG